MRNRVLGFVFQQFNLLARTSALENVELPLVYARGQREGARRQRATRGARARRARRADATTTRTSSPAGSSSASRSRARSSTSPKVILADEPTGALDSRTSVEVMALFQELGDAGITIVVVTHEPDVAAFASRVVVDEGRARSSPTQRQEPRLAAPATRSAEAAS